MNALGIVGVVFAVVAALIHVYIFTLESLLWSRPSTQRTFGVRDERDGEVLRPMAYNQGFYNLFLALGVLVGVVLVFADARDAGFAVTVFALASMLLAALVLVTSNRKMLRPALIQGAPPLLALVFLVSGVLGG
jgi:putative membrane protein